MKKPNYAPILPYFIFLFLVGLTLTLGCNSEGRGFALPKGDVEAGKTAFVKLRCNDCHSVGSIAWEKNDANAHVPLGGKVKRVQTYGELVTAIINPSHEIAKGFEQVGTLDDGNSKMRNYNQVMSVQALVDIVTFLQTEYELEIPNTYYYPY